MTKIEQLIETTLLAFEREIIKKLVFSRPKTSEVTKISARLVSHKGRKMLVFEHSLPGNTVSHKNVGKDTLADFLADLLGEYSQVNLITTLGDAEWKISRSGKEALLGADKLNNKMLSGIDGFESAIAALDNKKNYILSGNEEFLTLLGISDKNGRVHDKKQGKFRQINRFLEIIEDVYTDLPADGDVTIYDLCCGKSYLSFAVYYYLTEKKHRNVRLLGIDLKRDCIQWCADVAKLLGYTGMTFITDDVKNTPRGVVPDMVISLHACDIATDIVINRAAELGARIILSTPCCHKYLNDKIKAAELSFVTVHPHLRNKLAEALTDAIRVSRLEAEGYSVAAIELVDPDDTPKNTLIRAVKRKNADPARLEEQRKKYDRILDFVLGEEKSGYLSDI